MKRKDGKGKGKGNAACVQYERSAEEVAKAMGLSRGRVLQIERLALKKLKARMEREHMRDFLE